jgi:hypothetical protein
MKLLFLIFVQISGKSGEPAFVVYMLKRLEAYFSPVLWLASDDKVLLYLQTKLSKLARIYNFS